MVRLNAFAFLARSVHSNSGWSLLCCEVAADDPSTALEQPLSGHWEPVLLLAKAIESGPIVPPCLRGRGTGTRNSSFRHDYLFPREHQTAKTE